MQNPRDILSRLLTSLSELPGADAELPIQGGAVTKQELMDILRPSMSADTLEGSGPHRIPDRDEGRWSRAQLQLSKRLAVLQQYRHAMTRFVLEQYPEEAVAFLGVVDSLLDREQMRAVNGYLDGYVTTLIKRQGRQLRGIVNMASLIGLAGATADEILNVLAAEVSELFGGSEMYFHEVESADSFVPRRNPAGPIPKGAPPDSCFCICERSGDCPALSRWAPVIVNDRREGGCSFARPAEQIGSYMCVRAIAGGKRFGVMTVAAPEFEAFDDDDVEALVALANQAALALQRNRLREELETYTQRLEEMVYERTEELEVKNATLTVLGERLRTFNEVFANLDTFLDSKAGLAAACKALTQRFAAKAAMVWLARPGEPGEEATHYLHLVHAEGAESIFSGHDVQRVPFGELAVGKIAATSEKLVTNEAATHPMLEMRAELEAQGVQSVAGLPLTWEGDEVGGVLMVFSEKPILRETEEILSLFARQLGVVLHDAQRYRETREQAEEIRALNNELERINSDLEDFTYVVSHDLKEPLRGIEAFSRFLVEDYREVLGTDGVEYLDGLSRLTVRMKDLIQDLLTLSRIGRAESPPERVCLDEVAEEVSLRLGRAIEERGVKLELDGKLGCVSAQTVRITQLFQNLVGNAIKFNDKSEPTVKIGTVAERSDAARLCVYVRDNGIGIDPQYHDRIFGIFQRLHRREEYDGTGAGLTIVRKIVELYGGQISVESAPGEGTCFFFTLPRAEDDRPSGDAATA